MKLSMGKWSSAEKQQEYIEAYKKALHIMPEAKSIRIKTSFEPCMPLMHWEM